MEITRTTDDEQTTLWNGLAGHAWVALQEVLDQMFKPLEDLLVDAVFAGSGAGCSPSATARALARSPSRGCSARRRCIGIDIGSDDHRRPGPRRRESTPASFLRANAPTRLRAGTLRHDHVALRRHVLQGELTDVMHWKQKLAMAIRAQFRQPRGARVGSPGGKWRCGRRTASNVWAVGLLGVEPTDRVLEIGFGPGLAIRELSRRATHGLVYGVDHSAVMVRQATRRNAAAVRAGRVELRLGSAEQLPAFTEPFDKVLVVNNLGMWHEPDEG